MSAAHYTWDFGIFFRDLPFLLRGLLVTIEVSLLAIIVGSALGLVAALMRLSPVRPLRWTAAFYVDFLRATPLLIQLVGYSSGCRSCSAFRSLRCSRPC